MKILLITDNHTAGGGAEKYFFELKNKLKNISDIKVFSIGFADTKQGGKDFFVLPKAKTPAQKLYWRFIFHNRIYKQLREEILKFSPDVIHLHGIKQYTPTVLAAIADFPVVQTVHDFSLICPTAQNIHRNGNVCQTGFAARCFWQHQIKFSKIIFLLLSISFLRTKKHLQKIVHTFISPSPILQTYLQRNGFKKVSCIPPFTQELIPASFSTGQEKNFLYAGVLEKHKGVLFMLDEFATAIKQMPDLTLHIVGDGSEKMQLQKKVCQLDLSKNILFHGWQTDLSQFYLRSSALIFPSIGMESFGLVMTEAMIFSRAIIGANRSTVPWLVKDGETGLLFDPTKKGELSTKILQLAAQPELAKTFGQAGFRRVTALFDNEKQMQALLQVYGSAHSDHLR